MNRCKTCRKYEKLGLTPEKTKELLTLYEDLEVTSSDIQELNEIFKKMLAAKIDPKEFPKWLDEKIREKTG